MARATVDTVRFFWYAHQNRVDIEQLQRRVELFGFGDRRAEVGFSSHHERRSFDFTDEIGQRALHVLIRVFPRIAGKPIFGDERNVRGEREAVPVDDRIKRRRSAETISVLDGPAGEHATAAAAGYVKVVRVDVTFGDDGVDTIVEIVKIVAGISVVD